MASREDEAAAAQPLTRDHDKETNGDALPVVEVNQQVGLKCEVTLLKWHCPCCWCDYRLRDLLFISPKGALARTESVGMSLVVCTLCKLALLPRLRNQSDSCQKDLSGYTFGCVACP